MSKLSKAQERVMGLMSKRWTAHTVVGAIHINGKRVCNIDTMTVLVRLGLVEKDGQWTWKATPAGLAWTEASAAKPMPPGGADNRGAHA